MTDLTVDYVRSNLVMKTCSMCGYSKSLSEFNIDKEHLHGRDRLCRPCRKIYLLLYRYGVNLTEKLELYYAQGGRCPGCDGVFEVNEMYLDHDHATGKPRGVLCHHCNTVLGFARDKITTLLALADYLEAPTWQPTP
jgi:hypothetical protein